MHKTNKGEGIERGEYPKLKLMGNGGFLALRACRGKTGKRSMANGEFSTLHVLRKKRSEIDGCWRVSCIACVSRKNALKSMANDGFLGSLVRQGENAMKLMANGGFLALVGRV